MDGMEEISWKVICDACSSPYYGEAGKVYWLAATYHDAVYLAGYHHLIQGHRMRLVRIEKKTAQGTKAQYGTLPSPDEFRLIDAATKALSNNL